MASSAHNSHLVALLEDSENLVKAAGSLSTAATDRKAQLAALNRAIVVIAVSAWEAYIEELVREAVELLRPAAPSLGLWPAHNAAIRGQLGRFNNPNFENVRLLLSDALGLRDIQASWGWQNCTSLQARQRLAEAMTLRHEVAHGVQPRPDVSLQYARTVPELFRRLGRCTDRAVREHLVNVLAIANPWPL